LGEGKVDRLKDKVAVVTGSSLGIGAATAKLFGREGAKVVVVGNRNVAAGEAVVSAIKEECGDAIFVQAEMAKEADCKRLIDTAVSTFGKLDILINNAAICPNVPMTETTEEEFDHTMAVNVKGVFFCCKYAVPYMIQNGGGSIVTVTSRAVFIPTDCSAVYCASKGAAQSFTQAIAHEYAKDGIRANTILPSNIWTDMSRKWVSEHEDPAATAEHFDNSQPIGRAGTPEEAAHAILWLASDDASFITSAPLLVDGGYFFSG
jgi:NAD(P)-dependent dehydrogenase (short-subunit alcohol dehydrogenase family)